MLVIAHRGASAAETENTLAAFELADAMHADAVELDVRLARDGRLLVKHDALPTESTGLDGLPALDAALDACGEMLVNVEIKNTVDDPDHDPTGTVVARTVAALRRHGTPQRWLVSSFDWDTIQRCRRTAPDIATAYLVTDATPEIIDRTVAAGHLAIHPWEPTVTAAVVAQCHDVGLAVTTWTCNDHARILELDELGVDGVCTDVPDLAVRALGRTARPATAQWGRPA